MKYVLTAEEAAKFANLTPAVIRTTFRNGAEVPHIWAGNQLRIMSFPFLRFMEEHADVKTSARLRQYIKA